MRRLPQVAWAQFGGGGALAVAEEDEAPILVSLEVPKCGGPMLVVFHPMFQSFNP